MKFDKRITDIKIMNCFTTEDAKRYLHTYGYFADHIEDFVELDKLDRAELADINQDFKYPYSSCCVLPCNDNFRFFLPCAFVADEKEKKEKKLRPYTLDEFLEIFNQGDVIRFRYKIDKSKIFSLFLGYTIGNGNISIEIGHGTYDLEELFKYYEWQRSNSEDYKPFGVEE